jgi:hypothetical protein
MNSKYTRRVNLGKMVVATQSLSYFHDVIQPTPATTHILVLLLLLLLNEAAKALGDPDESCPTREP